ncbi:MAG: hypothetical protein AB7I41_17120 [Candidatus Sericytochromatia bacterium]
MVHLQVSQASPLIAIQSPNRSPQELQITSTRLDHNQMVVKFNRPIGMDEAVKKLFPDAINSRDIPPQFQISGGGNQTVEVTTAKGKIYQVHIPPRGCFGPPSDSVTVTEMTGHKPSLPLDRVQLPHPSQLKPLPSLTQPLVRNANADLTLKEIVNGNPWFTFRFDKAVVSLKALLPVLAPDAKFISEEKTDKGTVVTYLNGKGNQESLYLAKGSNQVEQKTYRDPSLPGMGLLINESEMPGGSHRIAQLNKRLKD